MPALVEETLVLLARFANVKVVLRAEAGSWEPPPPMLGQWPNWNIQHRKGVIFLITHRQHVVSNHRAAIVVVGGSYLWKSVEIQIEP